MIFCWGGGWTRSSSARLQASAWQHDETHAGPAIQQSRLALLSIMDKLQVAGRPVLLGLSRKRMLGAVLGDAEQGRAPLSTAVMTVWGHLHGAQIHRVHDVAECARALRLIRAAEPFVR